MWRPGPLIYGDKVIFGAWDENLYALNRKDGTPVVGMARRTTRYALFACSGVARSYTESGLYCSSRPVPVVY